MLFQSTLPHGERRTKATTNSQALLFQSTLPHGERRYRATVIAFLKGFNPRSRMGSDCAV